MTGRRLTIQLAPLVDLLLIVAFCQFLEVQEKSEELSKQSVVAVADRDAALARLNAALVELQSVDQRLQAASARALAAELHVAADKDRLEQSQGDLERALAQQRVLGELVTQLFQIPPDDVARIFDPARAAPGSQSPAELQQLKEKFQSLGLEKPGRMVEHLLSYEEIRKRCDVWDLHVDAQGVATVTAGNRSTRIRVITDEPDSVAVERFAADLYNWYRTLPQPKSLVLVLLTYDRSTRILVTSRVRQALPVVVARMQADSAGRTRFEYADLGFRVE
ncbi:hypothetical protein [Planctomicrobium sp. SH664]|uniref:hypothetical protein n=1 Tax=Planctomicrobium sp. SH664 TaxID=3448125 RepID=UPI003F5BCBAC